MWFAFNWEPTPLDETHIKKSDGLKKNMKIFPLEIHAISCWQQTGAFFGLSFSFLWIEIYNNQKISQIDLPGES